MENNEQGSSNQRSLIQVLELAVANTPEGSAPNQEVIAAASDSERREWLNQALASHTIDPLEVLKRSIEQLRQYSQNPDSVEDIGGSLEMLCEWCMEIDVANDFHKLGGFQYMNSLLESSNEEVRWRACDLVAELTQNNPYCQRAAMEAILLPRLLDLLDNDTHEQVKIKALYALSAGLLRGPGTESSQVTFAEQDGYSVLMRVMQSDTEKLKVKSALLITSLCAQPGVKDALCDMGMVQQLVSLLQREHDHSHEHVMAAILALVTDHARAASNARDARIGFKSLLQERIQLVAGKPEYMEEKDYCEKILEICFSEQQDEEPQR